MKVKHRKYAFVRLAGAALVIAGGATLITLSTTRISAASANNITWPYYGGDAANTRYLNADQITLANASQLKPAWVFHTGLNDPDASMEVSPVMTNGKLYVTDGDDEVFAIDPVTGKQIWKYHPSDMPPFSALSLCCGHNNRGVATNGGLVFLGRLDATLVALDSGTGAQVWKAVVDDYTKGYSITMAPQYVRGKVIVGVSGGEYLARGHVDAYDATTGNLVWRFYTTEPSTWAGTSYLQGGAPVWQTPAFDAGLGMLYFTTGNAGPDINGVNRAGTNLYTVCIVAVSIEKGTLQWYFQESHHDLWDYDATPPPVLLNVNGTPAIAHAGKTGYMFILDRRSGTPLFGVTETPVPTTPMWQNPWPTQPVSAIESLTPHAVISVPAGFTAAPQWTPPQETQLVMQPGAEGGLEWPPMAFSPRTGFVYHHARYIPQAFQTNPTNTTGGTLPGWGSTTDDVPGVGEFGVYGAVSTATGRIVWSNKSADPGDSGMLVAGDVVYYGETSGLFHGVNAATGDILFTFDGTSIPGGGGATAAPIGYVVNGREYIVNAFGGNPMEGGSPTGDAVVAFALPAK